VPKAIDEGQQARIPLVDVVAEATD